MSLQFLADSGGSVNMKSNEIKKCYKKIVSQTDEDEVCPSFRRRRLANVIHDESSRDSITCSPRKPDGAAFGLTTSEVNGPLVSTRYFESSCGLPSQLFNIIQVGYVYI